MEREWFHLRHLPFSGICQPCVSEKQESGKSAAKRIAADLPDSFVFQVCRGKISNGERIS